MTLGIEIRPAASTDVDSLVALNMALADETEQKQLTRQTVGLGVQSLLESPDLGFYLVAARDGEVVACAMVTYEWSDWRNGCFWWIQSVYVMARYRRQGIFRRLYQNIQATAEQRPDVCGLRLYVEQENNTAQSTYRSLGMHAAPYQMYETEFHRDRTI